MTSVEWRTARIREITSRTDPLLAGVLDIYQKSFPIEEQMLVSFFLKLLRDKEGGKKADFHFDVLAQEDQIGGFALYEIGPSESEAERGAYLWYIASNPEQRGQGIGSILYRHVIRTAFEKFNCRLLCFEIEEEEEAARRSGVEAAAFAAWRREWYLRQGAKVLEGTHYLCGVDWQPSLPMQVMIHANGPLTPEEALKIAREIQDESITVVGDLRLTP